MDSCGALAQKAVDACKTIATFTEVPGQITRTFLSPPMRECHRYLAAWMESLGMSVRVDAAGNLRALRPGPTASAPNIIIASHLDTVPDAGAYDGVLGVVLGITLVEALQGAELPFGIEVIGFSEEEGVRFGFPFIGSKALVGELGPDLLEKRDHAGITVQEAIQAYGLDPAKISDAQFTSPPLAYLEFHIEQGPCLERQGKSLAIVSDIAGQSRLEITFRGRAGHAGTTPMGMRTDAMMGAAECFLKWEEFAQETPGLTATVGVISAQPGVANVIPGQVTACLDVRHPNDEIRENAIQTMANLSEGIGARRGLCVLWKPLSTQSAVPLDVPLRNRIARSFEAHGQPVTELVSGAGHDAMILAPHCPAGMIFLRSPGGISHHPNEAVLIDDVQAALQVTLPLIQTL